MILTQNEDIHTQYIDNQYYLLVLVPLHPCSFRWNLIYADAYADLLWEKNTIRFLKSIAAERGVFFLLYNLRSF